MDWTSFLGNLFVAIAQRQRWAESDKLGGALHLVIPVAEGVVMHAAIAAPSGANSAPVVTMTQHPDLNAAWAAIAAGLSTPTTPGG